VTGPDEVDANPAGEGDTEAGEVEAGEVASVEDLAGTDAGGGVGRVDEPASMSPGLGGARAELLREYGVDEDEIVEADRTGHLTLLLMDRLACPDDPRYDVDDVAASTGLEPELISRMWRSLGLTLPRAGDRAFSDADVALLRFIGQLSATEVIDHDLTMQMARVVGSSMSRVANAVVDAVDPGDVDVDVDTDELDTDELDGNGGDLRGGDGESRSGDAMGDTTARGEAFAAIAPLMVPSLTEIMSLVWRRHLQAAARARMVREQEAGDPSHMVVGFADLVGFTALSQQIGPHELADVVERFEALAYDTIGHLGGRVVKMIGDEVMFAVPHERAAAEIALSLAERYAADDDLPDVRVGLASGPVLQREADVFGPVVNMAGRLVTLAFPATVLCSAEVCDALAGDVDLVCRDIGSRKVKDIGRVPLFVLRRADEADAPRSTRDRVGARWAERQEARVAEIDERRAQRRRSRSSEPDGPGDDSSD